MTGADGFCISADRSASLGMVSKDRDICWADNCNQ
jgi:hypothetical protein